MKVGDLYRLPLDPVYVPFAKVKFPTPSVDCLVDKVSASAYSLAFDQSVISHLEEELARALLDRGMVAVTPPALNVQPGPTPVSPSYELTVSVYCVRWPE